MACFIILTPSLLQCLQQAMYYNGYKHCHTPILGYVQTTNYGLQAIKMFLASSIEPTSPMDVYKEPLTLCTHNLSTKITLEKI
jgi:hypothetical protein